MKRFFTLSLFLFSLQLMAQPISDQFPVMYANDDAEEVVEDNIFVNPGDMTTMCYDSVIKLLGFALLT